MIDNYTIWQSKNCRIMFTRDAKKTSIISRQTQRNYSGEKMVQERIKSIAAQISEHFSNCDKEPS